jgi:integrase
MGGPQAGASPRASRRIQLIRSPLLRSLSTHPRSRPLTPDPRPTGQLCGGSRLKPTKTGQIRTVRILAPLAQDLNEWRLASGRPPEDALIFPARAGDVWTDADYKNWRRRHFIPAAKAASLAAPTPYDLRHGFASLLAAEGRSIYEIARQLGHKPSMTLDTYGHVLEELAGHRIDVEQEIRATREGGAKLSAAVCG